MFPLLAAGAGLTAWVIADLDPVSSLSQYGVLGLAVIALLTGWIVPGPTGKAKDAEISRLLIENQRLQGVVEDHLIPIAAEYAKSMQESSRVMGLAIEALKSKDG